MQWLGGQITWFKCMWLVHAALAQFTLTITERNESKISKLHVRALKVKSILESTFSLSSSLYGANFDRSVKKCFKSLSTEILGLFYQMVNC